MTFLRSVGLTGRLLAIVAVVVSIDFLLNTVIFERTAAFAVREDDAAWMAEHLVMAHRLIERSPPADRNVVARELSVGRFMISWSQTRAPLADAIELSTLRRQMLVAEPALKSANLHLKLMPLSNGGNIGGSTTLRDGSLLVFRAYSPATWSLNLGRIVGLALPSLLLLLLAWILFRVTLKPLRALVDAASEVGSGDPRPLPETGQAEVLRLIQAFNTMQERIHQLLASGSQTLLAIGHDLRTPLSRLQLRIESASLEPGLRQEIAHDIEEMRALLQSLQTYVESGDDHTASELIDIASTAQTQVDDARDRGGRVSYRGPSHLEIVTRPVAFRRALSNLIENAVAYAGNARVELQQRDGMVEIAVDDDGPGIPEDRMTDVLRPFVRLDNARARNTAGMGLGLPIVDRVTKAAGGTLELANKPSGGLRVTIRLPYTAA